MDPHITSIIPNMLRLQLKTEAMRRLLPVILRMAALIPSAPNIAADKANPEVVGTVADAAEIRYFAAEGELGWVVRVIRRAIGRFGSGEEGGVGGAADGTA
jgi:hypothetical protein